MPSSGYHEAWFWCPKVFLALGEPQESPAKRLQRICGCALVRATSLRLTDYCLIQCVKILRLINWNLGLSIEPSFKKSCAHSDERAVKRLNRYIILVRLNKRWAPTMESVPSNRNFAFSKAPISDLRTVFRSLRSRFERQQTRQSRRFHALFRVSQTWFPAPQFFVAISTSGIIFLPQKKNLEIIPP